MKLWLKRPFSLSTLHVIGSHFHVTYEFVKPDYVSFVHHAQNCVVVDLL